MWERIVSRPVPAELPDFPLPFYVRSTGVTQLDKGPSYSYIPSYVQIFWGLQGRGEFIMADGQKIQLTKGEVCYYLPGEKRCFYSLSSTCRHRWVNFDGPLAEEFMKNYNYPRHITNLGECPEDIFMELELGLKKITYASQRKLLAALMLLLARIGKSYDDDSADNKLVKQFVDIVDRNLEDEAINVNEIAEIMQIHRSTLNRICQKDLQMAPGKYLTQVRLQRALSLLRETNLPIREIGAKTGFPIPNHFARIIKKATGMTASEYRRML